MTQGLPDTKLAAHLARAKGCSWAHWQLGQSLDRTQEGTSATRREEAPRCPCRRRCGPRSLLEKGPAAASGLVSSSLL